MSSYPYRPLPAGSTRLLRLMPAQNDAKIECSLSPYALRETERRTHLYEALSYVWGTQNKTRSITLDNHDFPVTENLHAALLHLRDRSLVRTIWVDAISINQADLDERGHQVQFMAEIYARANRVVVWLGDAGEDGDGGGDRALGDIRAASEEAFSNGASLHTVAAHSTPTISSGDSAVHPTAAAGDVSAHSAKPLVNILTQKRVLKLLQRPWFQRIWVRV